MKKKETINDLQRGYLYCCDQGHNSLTIRFKNKICTKRILSIKSYEMYFVF